MSLVHLVAGAALGTAATAVAARARSAGAFVFSSQPAGIVHKTPDRCPCGCRALEVQVAHWRQQAQRLAAQMPRSLN